MDWQPHALDSYGGPASPVVFPKKDAIEIYPPVSLAVTVGNRIYVCMKNGSLWPWGRRPWGRRQCRQPSQKVRSGERLSSRPSGRITMSGMRGPSMHKERPVRPDKLPIKRGINANLHLPTPFLQDISKEATA
jgi:hypothetical protein